jgi:hypothetical protein
VQKLLDKAEDTFVTRAKEIRNRHILVVDYDQQMIAALSEYRDRMQSVLDEDEAISGTRWRCTGKPLADLKLDERPKFEKVQGYLLTFEKAVKEDPKDVYIP